jgi:DNA polymerase
MTNVMSATDSAIIPSMIGAATSVTASLAPNAAEMASNAVRKMRKFPVLHRDYETRSCVDLKQVGAHVYSADPSTRILIAVWIIEREQGEYEDPIVWLGKMDAYAASPPMPYAIAGLIKSGCTVAGHNAAFEAAIDAYRAGPVLGWPIPKLEQLDCTMARAAVQALPLDLERLGVALGLTIQKDRAGHRLMLSMCKPRKPRKDEDPNGVYWHYDADKLVRLTSYCVADVRAEIAADRALRPLQANERRVWLLDQAVNNRGVEIDTAFVRTAHKLITRAERHANKRMRQITGGAVDAVTQIARLKTWAQSRGVELPVIKKTRRSGEHFEAAAADKEALQDLLDGELPDDVRKAFELRLEAAKSSLKKLDRFLSQAPLGRARGNLQYHAAGPGRWGGRGIQLQNLVRAGVTEQGGWEQAWRDMRDLGDDAFELVWGSPFDIVSRMMRGALIAKPEHQLYHADYSQVEARGCVWAAGQQDVVDLFAINAPVYEETASRIFDVAVEDVTADQRFLGKQTILGCNYGMGPAKFQKTCKKQRRVITPELAEQAVHGWRALNPKVVELWRKLEDAAKNAICHPKQEYSVERFVTYRRIGKWLQCRLPSGRILWYRKPTLEPSDEDVVRWGGFDRVPIDRWRITYWGVNGLTKQWTKESTWGGKLLENGMQGMCRDFLAGAMLRLEAKGYSVVLSVHDEVIAEAPTTFGGVEEFIHIMQHVPEWAPGFPLKAEGGRGFRYNK